MTIVAPNYQGVSGVGTSDDGTNAIITINGVKYMAWNKTTFQTRARASYDVDQTF